MPYGSAVFKEQKCLNPDALHTLILPLRETGEQKRIWLRLAFETFCSEYIIKIKEML